MKAGELREKTRKELLALLEKKRKELLKRKMELKVGKLRNVHLPSLIRKDIARILTVLKEKELLQ